MFIGQNGDTPTGLDPGVLGRRLAQRPLASPVIRVTSGDRVEPAPVNPEEYFCCLGGGVLATQRTLDGAIRQPAVEELEWSIQEADIGANCDAHPTAILESLLVRAEVADGVASSLPERRPPEYPSDRGTWRVCAAGTPLAVALCVGVAAGVKGRRRNWNSPAARRWILGLAAFAAGLFGMTLEITLLTSYQAARGYVYSEIGGISGSFMAGLALGAWCSGRLTARARISVILLMTAMLAMISAVPAIARQWSDWSGPLTAAGCWLLVFAAGVLDGAIFPLLASRGQDAHDSRFGGWAYAADLAGAAMGGLLCGAVWLPLFGLAGAMGLAAAVLSVALISFVLAP
jgi:hypothetical protein